MIYFKKDGLILNKFLGNTDGVIGIASPFKCARFYFKIGEGINSAVLIVTPLMYEDKENLINEVVSGFKSAKLIERKEHHLYDVCAITFNEVDS
jgi:hypothetical protein